MTTRRHLLLGVVLAVLSALHLAACKHAEPRAAAPAPTAEARAPGQGPAGPTRRRAALEVRATFQLTVADVGRASALHRELTTLAESSGGFVASSAVGEIRRTRLVLRVPPDQLGAVRRILTRAAGAEPLREEVSSTDVTEALADLDARLRAHRAAEARLLALLEQRTGTLADVLAVERSLVEVRERIERLEAEQRGAQGRVDLATVTVEVDLRDELVSHPIGRQAAEALRDGFTAARVVSVGLLLAALRIVPPLLVLAGPVVLLVLAARWLRRRR